MYNDPQQQQQHQHQHQLSMPPPQGGDFHRGPLPPPPMMRQHSASSANMAPEFRHLSGPAPPYDAHGDAFNAKRMKRIVQRKAVDYTSTVVRYIQIRMWQRNSMDRTILQATPAAAIDMLPAVAYPDNPSTSFATKFVHASLNKNRCSINRVLWTPTGRRLITGSHSGEFTLWNGQTFNFEMILQAHDKAVRSMVWSHNENWMVTGDDGGSIKYWQNNLNNVKANKSAHKESVRDLSFCKTDLKFCSCSDDTTVKVWDFARCQEERSLSGHGWDVKSVDWHPAKSLLVSGGKDNLVKLWDARSGRELCSFHGHKNIVNCVKWNENGNWLLTGSKDQSIKLYEIRTMKELESFRGHQRDVTVMAWHPFHEEYFVSGCFDGSIYHWVVGHETPQVEVLNAHEGSVWDLAWHPIGYVLCSGSFDQSTKFWSRNRPGDSARDKLNYGNSQVYGEQNPGMMGMGGRNLSIGESGGPGPFGNRNEGTIPGVGLAIPLSMDASTITQGGQPPLPPGPHPSLLHHYPPRHMHHHHQQQQQPLLPPSSHHLPHLQRPPLNIPPSSSMPPPMGMMQGGGMGPMSQGLHYMNAVPPQAAGVLQNQMYGNRPLSLVHPLNLYQSGNPNVQPPLPPGPPPHHQNPK